MNPGTVSVSTGTLESTLVDIIRPRKRYTKVVSITTINAYNDIGEYEQTTDIKNSCGPHRTII